MAGLLQHRRRTVGAPAPDARVSLDYVVQGQTVASQVVGTLPHTVYARDLPLVARTSGATVEVWIDGRRIGQAASTAFADAPPHPAAGAGGSYARVADVVVTTPAPPPADACAGRLGADALPCVRAGFAPLRTYDADEAFDRLIGTVAPSGAGAGDRTAEGVYGGAAAVWSPLSALSPRAQVEADAFVAESVWPRARRAPAGGPAATDLHTLALGRTVAVAVAFDGLAAGSVEIAVEVPRLAPGTYILRVATPDGEARTRFVVAR